MPVHPSESTALIIGASRGLGLGLVREYLARGWQVVATVRGTAVTQLHELVAGSSGRLTIESVDIVEAEQIAALRRRLAGRAFDLLFVNAGVANGPKEILLDTTAEEFVRVMVTNALAPLRVVEALRDLVPAGGTIALMSSRLGSVAENDKGGWEVYRASKASLNMFMRSYAIRRAGDAHTLLLLTPGWVRTDMGGPNANLSVEESVTGLADTIAAQAGKPGLQYLDYRGATVAW
jgi:NAD(P)-dependent dehydrogenase (short-subunit alcohol dehydrogenase family)